MQNLSTEIGGNTSRSLSEAHVYTYIYMCIYLYLCIYMSIYAYTHVFISTSAAARNHSLTATEDNTNDTNIGAAKLASSGASDKSRSSS